MLIVCLYFIASCSLQKSKSVKEVNEEEICVLINYKQPFNGYNVSAIINTDSEYEKYFSDIVSRDAVLTFKKDRQEISLVNPSFACKNLIDDTVSFIDGMKIDVDYTPFKISADNTFGGNNSPFFMFDVDFDDEEELIICLWGSMGHRNCHAYQAYKLNIGDGVHRLSPMLEEPFCDLNDYTEFDTINKIITVPQGVDIKIGGHKLYGLVNDSLKLIEHLVYDWKHTEGVKYTPCAPNIYHYRITNGKEVLEWIEKCPNDTE